MNRLTRIGVAAVLAAASALAFSQAPPAGGGGPGGPPNPEAQAKTAIETRQGLFKVIQSQNGPMGAMMRGEFNAAVATRNAGRIQMLADMIPELFTADTRAFTTVKTRALDGIWNSQPDFKAKAEALSKAAAGVVEAAKSNDKATVQAAFTKMGQACGACHDNYRAK
ncbi:MAG: cytochrome c [Steroidobacteraceae bacterium]